MHRETESHWKCHCQ